MQHIVCHAEGILQVHALIHDLQEAVVGDHDQRIGVLLQLINAQLSRLDAAAAFEGEGAGNDADGQGAHIAGHLRHDGRGARAGPAAHARGDEDHICAAQHLVELVSRFLGRLLAGLRQAARAKAAGQLLANPHARRCAGKHQRLRVGIDGDELHAGQTFFDHPFDGVATAAAHAHHFDVGEGL